MFSEPEKTCQRIEPKLEMYGNRAGMVSSCLRLILIFYWWNRGKSELLDWTLISAYQPRTYKSGFLFTSPKELNRNGPETGPFDNQTSSSILILLDTSSICNFYRFLVNKPTQEEGTRSETGHTNTPTDDVFAYSGESMQNPLPWCRVHVWYPDSNRLRM
jgi:hypothetical protein